MIWFEGVHLAPNLCFLAIFESLLRFILGFAFLLPVWIDSWLVLHVFVRICDVSYVRCIFSSVSLFLTYLDNSDAV